MDDTATPAGPRARYEADLQSPDFVHDPAQFQAVEALQSIYDQLLNKPEKSHGLFGHKKERPHIEGLYLWGGVGRGKTYLMDCFFDTLPIDDKVRLHFHRFMAKVHEARKRYAHQTDPLKKIAAEWAADRVLCFDEFFVSDIADAMILSRLTEALFEHNVTLVTTSNVAPDDLYKGGLKRDRFLPAIERLKNNCRVMHMEDGTDFRLDHIEQSVTYQVPPGEAADATLAKAFNRLATGETVNVGNVEILGRKLPTRKSADTVVWFDFDTLCRTPRSANDYIELAREFSVIMISGVPVLGVADNNAARRFISAIDEFYDRRVNVFVTAEAGPDNLYTSSRLAFEFERTTSRLHEMSTTEYLSAAHRS
jgi:cell division protein ZapE